jgi:trehalose 6-phosphate synthase
VQVAETPRHPDDPKRNDVSSEARRDETSALVIAANRLPVEVGPEGGVMPSPGGLASALSAVMASGCTWVGWAGPDSPATPPFTFGETRLHPIALSSTEARRYYLGFSNSVLWPLFHGRVRREEMTRSWWRTYRGVNERFAAAIARDAAPKATVWVHDYHLLLVPRMLRARRPDLRVGLFVHIPFPNPQLFSLLPWRQEVVAGMLGANLIGFQVAEDADNFIATAERVSDVRADGRIIRTNGRAVEVDAFPISVDFTHWDELGGAAQDEAAALRRRLGVTTVFLGIDRLDYTKGITQRLQAFQELLQEGRLDAADCVFVQIGVPSRADISAYQEERAEVERLVASINRAHTRPDGSTPVEFIESSLDDPGLATWYRAADTLVVTSLADGMNLIAKEFVASRGDGGGVVVLSEFAGAASDLTDALVVNPYDIDAIKQAMLQSRELSVTEQQGRMTAMRDSVRLHDVHHWADQFLERLRADHIGREHTVRGWVSRVRERLAARAR